jgi:hypothetical protein
MVTYTSINLLQHPITLRLTHKVAYIYSLRLILIIINSLNSINEFIFIMETCCVLFNLNT